MLSSASFPLAATNSAPNRLAMSPGKESHGIYLLYSVALAADLTGTLETRFQAKEAKRKSTNIRKGTWSHRTIEAT